MSEYLIHHGTKGMKWGVRKYQNEDGSLTPAGKQRYGHSLKGTIYRLSAGAHEKIYSKIGTKTMRGMSKRTAEYARKKAAEADAAAAARKEAEFKERANRAAGKDGEKRSITKKQILIGAAAVAAIAGGAYLGYKLYDKRVPKYVNVGKTIVEKSGDAYAKDLSKWFPQPDPSHPNKILKSTFNVASSSEHLRKVKYSRSIPNPDRKFFKAKRAPDFAEGMISRMNKDFASRNYTDSEKKIFEKFNSDVAKAVSDYQSGKIKRKEYADIIRRLKS